MSVSTLLQIADGFGDVDAPKENKGDYQSAIEGWSLGGGGAAGVESSEVAATTAARSTLFAGRYVPKDRKVSMGIYYRGDGPNF